jgi:hypothetical protein
MAFFLVWEFVFDPRVWIKFGDLFLIFDFIFRKDGAWRNGISNRTIYGKCPKSGKWLSSDMRVPKTLKMIHLTQKLDHRARNNSQSVRSKEYDFESEWGELAANLIKNLHQIECMATNGATICFLRPFSQTLVMQNMTAGFNQSNKLLVGCFAGIGCWFWWCCRHRISKIIVNYCVRNNVQLVQTDDALVSHADE